MSETMQLGNLPEANQGRDAVHVAIAPMIAAERLSPGQHVGLIGDRAGSTAKTIGIVDPFLRGAVFEGERFWLVLYPQTITSLRHVWEHPAFSGGEGSVSASEKWLREMAEQVGVSYSRLLNAAKEHIEFDEYLVGGGEMEGVITPDEFWDHYEAVTGTRVPHEKRGNFFSCSC